MFSELARHPSSSATDDAAVLRGRDSVHSIVTKAMERVDVAYITDAYSLLATLARIDHEEEVSRRRVLLLDARGARTDCRTPLLPPFLLIYHEHRVWSGLWADLLPGECVLDADSDNKDRGGFGDLQQHLQNPVCLHLDPPPCV